MLDRGKFLPSFSDGWAKSKRIIQFAERSQYFKRSCKKEKDSDTSKYISVLVSFCLEFELHCPSEELLILSGTYKN